MTHKIRPFNKTAETTRHLLKTKTTHAANKRLQCEMNVIFENVLSLVRTRNRALMSIVSITT